MRVTAYKLRKTPSTAEAASLDVGQLVRIDESALEDAGLSDIEFKEELDDEFDYKQMGFITEVHEDDFTWVGPDKEESVTVDVGDEPVYIVGLAASTAGAHPFQADALEPVDRDNVLGDIDVDTDPEAVDDDAAEAMRQYPGHQTRAVLASQYDASMDELDEVYSDWDDAVNMTASALQRWSENPCSREASVDPHAVIKRNLRLFETNKSDWDTDDIADAKRTISFIERMGDEENEPEAPMDGTHGCPTEWAISLLNWAYNPFDELPDHPDELDEDVDEVTLSDDVPADKDVEELVSVSDVPGISRNDMGLAPWPESWRESDKPARLIALDAWTSMGGTFRGCRRSLVGSVRNPNRLCASWKDAILGHEMWRSGG